VDVDEESVIEVVVEVLSSCSILIKGRFWRDFPASVIEVVYSSSSFLISSS